MQVSNSPSGAAVIITGLIAAFDPADCGAAAVTLQSVAGLPCIPGDMVLVRPTTHIADLGWCPGSCTVAGTALIPVVNPTAGAINPGAGAYAFCIIRTAPSP